MLWLVFGGSQFPEMVLEITHLLAIQPLDVAASPRISSVTMKVLNYISFILMNSNC
jgi:hypothetical protein